MSMKIDFKNSLGEPRRFVIEPSYYCKMISTGKPCPPYEEIPSDQPKVLNDFYKYVCQHCKNYGFIMEFNLDFTSIGV